MLLLALDGKVLPLGPESGLERPLGAALVCCPDESILDALAAAFHEQTCFPWCPLVLATNVVVREETLKDLRPNVARITTIRLEIDRTAPTFDEVRTALVRHGSPSRAEVVDFVNLRTQDGLADAVAEALKGPDAWSVALRRRLSRLETPSPQHWMNLFWLATYLSAAEHPGPRTLEQVALDFNRAPRTVSAWCAKYLGCSWTEARGRLGWEWIFEATLRAAGHAPPRGAARGRVWAHGIRLASGRLHDSSAGSR